MTAPTPVILDVDTGVDDALALLLAVRSPALDLLAVTCVAGNVGVDQVVANTALVLDAAGAGPGVPMARGADRPLLDPPRPPRHAHGTDGMGDLKLPRSQRLVDSRHAVELLRDTLRAAEQPVTLVPLAPLTNLALLLRTYPDVADQVARILLMGGGTSGGNIAARTEFNLHADPEAAAIVLGSGLPLTMYGLDVFSQVRIDHSVAEELRVSGDPAAQLAGRLLAHSIARYNGAPAPIGDAGAVAAVIAPDGLTTAPHRVRVELTGRFTRGQTVVDRREWHPDLSGSDHRHARPEAPAGVAEIAFDTDADRYRDIFLRALRAGTAT